MSTNSAARNTKCSFPAQQAPESGSCWTCPAGGQPTQFTHAPSLASRTTKTVVIYVAGEQSILSVKDPKFPGLYTQTVSLFKLRSLLAYACPYQFIEPLTTLQCILIAHLNITIHRDKVTHVLGGIVQQQ